MSTTPPTIRISHASDYACLDVGSLETYYGYEYAWFLDIATDADTPVEQTWGLVIKKADQIVFERSYEQMAPPKGDPEMFECADCLLYGIGLYLASLEGAV